MMRRLQILIAIIFIAYSAKAQPGDPPNGGKPDSSVPLTGVEILVGLGSLFGVKKIFDSRKKKD